MDQISSKTLQLQEPAPLLHQGGAGRALACQAGHGDAEPGKVWELVSSGTRRTAPAPLAALIYRAGSEPWQQAKTGTSAQCSLQAGCAQAGCACTVAAKAGWGKNSGGKLPAVGTEVPLPAQPATWQDFLLARGLAPEYHG